jgi:hypothetical protein
VKPPTFADLGLSEAAEKAFVTALLLTGNAETAESAVLESIERMSLEDTSGEELLQAAVKTAIRPQERPWRPLKDWEPASARLPLELRSVLCLAPDVRQCFVLRVLVGLPSHACAALLDSDADQVDRGACAAMLQLASKGAARYATHSGSKN